MQLYLIQTLVYVLLISLFYKRTNGFVQTDILLYCTLKTLPVLLLSAFSFYGSSNFTTHRRSIFALGLLFGALGDFLLSTGRNGFVLGSISFAAGHIMYVAYFGAQLEGWSVPVIVLCTVYTFLTNYYIIVPHFYRSKTLFRVLIMYSLVICSGMIVAGSLYFNGAVSGANGSDYTSIALGYFLFVASDTCIILRLIGYKSEYFHEFILFTYYAAQYAIYRNAISSQSNFTD